MPVTFRQHLITWFAPLGVIIIAAWVIVFAWQLPQLKSLREKIDANRASLSILQDQQSNLQALKSETDNIVSIKTSLEKEIWTFANEDNFFERLDMLATNAGVKIDEPVIANATPSDRPLSRTVTITFHGPALKLYAVLDEIQRFSPLIAISETQFSGGPDYNLTIVGQTVWQ